MGGPGGRESVAVVVVVVEAVVVVVVEHIDNSRGSQAEIGSILTYPTRAAAETKPRERCTRTAGRYASDRCLMEDEHEPPRV